MKNTNEPCGFSLHRWQSEESDLTALEPRLAALLTFNMLVINEFEHALLRLKKDDCVWGPVHSSVGQEAAAVGAIGSLRRGDKVFSTHRAHHQFLAKALGYVLPESWDPRSEALPGAGADVIYRTMAEIMGLEPGYCGGRGGSMHLRWAEAGFLGSNAIVGGGIPLATGAAFAEKSRKSGNIALCFFGDGAINQGAFHEACNLAGAWQLPIIYFVENNLYAVATAVDQACAVRDLAVRAQSYGMEGHVVSGDDVLAIHELTRRVADEVRRTNRPALIEAKCYRRYHHAGDLPGSAFGYRSKQEEEERRRANAIESFPSDLIQAGVLKEADVTAIRQKAVECVERAVEACTEGEKPRKVRAELWPKPSSATVGVRSSGSELADLPYRERENFSEFKQMKFSDLLSAVTGRWIERDSSAFVMGEEVANFGGGAYGATKGLPAKYPDRVLNTPISEAGFVGLGLGAAMLGMRPVVEIMFPDFSLVAADQVFNQVAKARHMYGNTTDLPLVVRTRVAIGCGYGGQHSMDPIGLYALFPGWRIVSPSNGFDLIGLFNTAMHSLDPVLILEYHDLYAQKFPVPVDDLDYCIPFGKARIAHEGTGVSIISYGVMAARCEALLGQLDAQGISAELIDLRTVDPVGIDYAAIVKSIKKTRAAVIVEEAPTSMSIGPAIANRIYPDCFADLNAPVLCLASLDVPNPVSRVLEAAAVISDEKIVEGIGRLVRSMKDKVQSTK